MKLDDSIEEVAITLATFRLRPAAFAVLVALLLAGCSARQAQDSLTGSTAQRLVSHGIDDIAAQLPERDFSAHVGQRMRLNSYFVADEALRFYADRRLEIALARRFDIRTVPAGETADFTLNVFYTSLGTNRDTKGFYLPLGYLPGLDQTTQIDLITLEQFHGVAELYYFVGPTGTERRGAVIQARTRTDAIGLPIITIPVSDIRRD